MNMELFEKGVIALSGITKELLELSLECYEEKEREEMEKEAMEENE